MSLSVPPAQYTGLSTDTKPIPVDATIGTTYYETDTFRTLFWTGTNWKTHEQLFKEGRWIGILPTGGTSGIFSSNIGSAGTFTRLYNATYGLHQQIDTTSTINTFAGIKNTNSYAERALNGYLRIVFRLDQVSDCNLFVGWTGYGAALGIPGGATISDPFPNNSAIGLKLEANASDFTLYHNDGNSPGTTEVTPIAPADSQLHTFEIRAINSVPRYQYKIDHATSWVDVDTDIPIETNEMYLQCWIQNTVASSKLWRLVDVFTRIDNKG